MLSIGRISDAEYYLALAREDYYLLGGEPPGIWAGSGSDELGLGRQVEQGDLRNLLQGFGRDGTPLIQNAGHARHQAGWDLTFSAPKDVSVVWAVASETTRREIQNAQLTAVKAAIRYLEKHAAFTRTGKGGVNSERVKLLVACFEHGTSRAQDPQLHTHALVLNVCVSETGQTRTLLSRPLYLHKMAAGAIYRAELAAELRKLGFVIEPDGAFFNIEGVPSELAEFFSKRREEIERLLRSRGFHSQKAAETAARVTRNPKLEIPRVELLEMWKAAAASYDFQEANAEQLRSAAHSQRPSRCGPKHVQQAIHQATAQQSYFTRPQIVQELAKQGIGEAWDAETIEAAIDDNFQCGENILGLGELNQLEYFATKQHFEIEKCLLSDIGKLCERRHVVAIDVVQQALQRTDARLAAMSSELSAEQVEAVCHLTLSPADIALVNGMPGTGKTTMLGTCRDAWEQAGYRVLGCTLSAQAARELHNGSGIESFTIAKLLFEWDKGATRLSHDIAQLQRAWEGRDTKRFQNFTLDERTILVVDETSMADTQSLTRLCSEAETRGAKLVLVGDTRQLSAIGPGGAFAHLVEHVGCVEMASVTRQKHFRDIEAIHNLAHGEAMKALDSYELRNMLTIRDTREEAMRQLVDDWAMTALASPQETVILAATRSAVHRLNELCQAKRQEVDSSALTYLTVTHDEFTEKIYVGDRVVCRQNSKLYGVLNGDLGVVVALNPLTRTMTVLLDAKEQGKERTVAIPLDDYPKVQLGYAQTTHSKQGATLDHVYVLLGGSMQDKELTFVEASRHRQQLLLYTDVFEAGRDLEGLAEQMSRSHAKAMAHDILQEIQERRSSELEQTIEADARETAAPEADSTLTQVELELEQIQRWLNDGTIPREFRRIVEPSVEQAIDIPRAGSRSDEAIELDDEASRRVEADRAARERSLRQDIEHQQNL